MNNDTSNAKDFFLHLLSSITLYMSAIGFLMISFQLIGYLFPDTQLGYLQGDYSSRVLRIGISMILITLPVFFWTRIFLGKMYISEPDRKRFKLRKWLMYLTLFISAIIIIISLIMTINVFLSGELTTRFFFKVLVTVFVAVVIFSYYFLDIKDTLTKKKRTVYIWTTSILSIILVISSFWFIGSPKKARLQRFDNERISDLNTLVYAIENYHSTNEILPVKLDDMPSTDIRIDNSVDPITGKRYLYEVIEKDKYKLCAIFDTDTKDENIPRDYTTNWWDINWAHTKGLYCFEKEIARINIEKPAFR